MGDTIRILSAEDFDRLASEAPGDRRPCVEGVRVERDRFGVVPPGEMLLIQTPDFSPLRHAAFNREQMTTFAYDILAYRYLPLAMPKPQLFVGIDWGSDDRTVITVFNPWRIFHDRWHGTTAANLRWQLRLDWSSNVRRQKRAEELQRRKVRG